MRACSYSSVHPAEHFKQFNFRRKFYFQSQALVHITSSETNQFHSSSTLKICVFLCVFFFSFFLFLSIFAFVVVVSFIAVSDANFCREGGVHDWQNLSNSSILLWNMTL